MSPRRTLLGAFFSLLPAILLVGCDGEPASPTPGATSPTATQRPDMGTIAYIDANGCIARAPGNGSRATVAPFCPETRLGVSVLAWQDEASIAYIVPETQALGWRMVDFAANTDEALSVDESPRIRIFTTAPWYRSLANEIIEIDPNGVVSRVDESAKVPIFTSGLNNTARGTPRLATWSPDNQWILLFMSPNDGLWVVSRDGSTSFEVAAASRGQVSWFMPGLGALPHLDLTCTTPSAFGCQVTLQAPANETSVPAAAAKGALRFGWGVCPGATGYEIEVLPSGSETAKVSHLLVGTSYRLQLSQIASGSASGVWRWRVRALIGSKQGPWSPERTFSFGEAAVAP